MEEYRRLLEGGRSGSVEDMVKLGVALEEGIGVERSTDDALCWFLHAMNEEARRRIVALHKRGRGSAKVYQEAMRRYIELNDAPSFFALGWLHFWGYGVPKNYEEAMRWWIKGTALGDAKSMAGIGVLYRFGCGVSENYGEAMHWFVTAASLGDPTAMAHIGDLYRFGCGRPQNYEVGLQWYTKAADLGSTKAWVALGFLYSNGHGVSKNLDLSIECYLRSGTRGYDRAFHLLSSFSPTQLLRVAISVNVKSILEFALTLPGLDASAHLDGTDVLTYALKKGCSHSVAVLKELCLEKSLCVMFVGQAGSGKTRLKHLLMGKDDIQNVAKLMDVVDVVLEQGVRLRLIDFDAQSGHYLRQQFFAGHERLLTIVCVDVRMCQDEMRREVQTWLELVCHRGRGCALVAFAATHGDVCNNLTAQLSLLQSQVTLLREHYSLEFLDEKQPVWLHGGSEPEAWEALRKAIVGRCLAAKNRLVNSEVIKTLARVKHASNGGQNAILLSQFASTVDEEVLVRAHLEKLHGLGELFYHPGAKAVAVGMRLVLNVFDRIRQASDSRMDPMRCHVWWGWNWHWSEATVWITDNQLLVSWKGNFVDYRFALLGCSVEEKSDSREMVLHLGTGVDFWVRLLTLESKEAMVATVQANSLPSGRMRHSQISTECVLKVLNTELRTPEEQMLVLGMLESMGALIPVGQRAYIVSFLPSM